MAHDKQCKDTPARLGMVKGFRCPKRGESYWDRHRQRICKADKDMHEPFLIVEQEGRLK